MQQKRLEEATLEKMVGSGLWAAFSPVTHAQAECAVSASERRGELARGELFQVNKSVVDSNYGL